MCSLEKGAASFSSRVVDTTFFDGTFDSKGVSACMLIHSLLESYTVTRLKYNIGERNAAGSFRERITFIAFIGLGGEGFAQSLGKRVGCPIGPLLRGTRWYLGPRRRSRVLTKRLVGVN